MSGVRDLKRRISGIKNMKKITGALHMISSARLKGVQKSVQDYNYFLEKVRDIVSLIPAGEKFAGENPPLVIVMASDRGLAGGYNAGILRLAHEKIDGLKAKDIITVGEKARKFFVQKGYSPLLWYTNMEKELPPTVLGEITGKVFEAHKKGSAVYTAYTRFISPAKLIPEVAKILPLERGRKVKEEIIFEPSPEELLDLILEFYVKSTLQGLFLNSYACEQASRMRAMESAAENADDLLEELTLKFHTERKAVITREITEIVSGAENYLH